ncbi:arabinose efflux permease family protein [Beggiatoa alba B18LD]|uniref:Arabinose efflux permease family protein n=1 Tax=Beggiatoa alba B18LD TaxID=395493 RepID=I3CF28_9GAMM|nr:MFS transporter [Beggiatoa alba]EIJ42221.1 arabinose efflux permease family protein [Beggiatoa alba B18LD]
MTEQPLVESTGYAKKIRNRLFTFSIILLILSSAGISYFALQAFENELMPEINKKSVAVGNTINQVLLRTIHYGVPFENLEGVNALFTKVISDHPDIQYIALTNSTGETLYSVGTVDDKLRNYFHQLAPNLSKRHESSQISLFDNFYNTTMPLWGDEQLIGVLHLGVDQKLVQRSLEEITYDILIVLLVSLLITFELLLFLITLNISTPIRLINNVLVRARYGNFSYTIANQSQDEIGRFVSAFNQLIQKINLQYQAVSTQLDKLKDKSMEALRLVTLFRERYTISGNEPYKVSEKNLINIRIPVFLFMLAEELSRSFFPIYVRELYAPIIGLSQDIVIGLPISLFMLLVAVAMPLSGRWCDYYGSRRIFLIGLIPSTIGFIGTSLAFNLYDLLFWRSFSAFGYGMMFIACQGYIANNTTSVNRSQGVAMFVGAVMAASMCGPPIGGILADQIGFRAVFIMSAFLSVPAGIMVYLFLKDEVGNKETSKRAKPASMWELFILFKNVRFVVLSFLSAFPTKFALTGFIFFLVPLYLHSLDNNQATIGRVLMLYGIAAILISPLSATLADRWKQKRLFVSIGGFIGAIGILLILYWQSTLAIVISVTLLGIAHAISLSPQLALVPDICPAETQRLGQATVISFFRLIERMGAVAGSLVAAIFVGLYGYTGAIVGIGLWILVSSCLFTLAFLVLGTTPKATKTDIDTVVTP